MLGSKIKGKPTKLSSKRIESFASSVIQVSLMVKEERGAEACCWRSQTSDPRRPALKALSNLSLNVSDTLRATRAK